ncbi:hypothetical protein, variant [Puccinia striiformis f. sp. tritici PST-78]|uniref:SET domain-containing protein n=1 Tax=Puccinia striiformis f. sp. tritici PST-78 TaxID=1165861 RepID=A0A0L0VF20_9BASI|nr:hypothetical protein PSTG_09127 [Puccinia striiformis f. sp. tritici PST-78]KNE97579.1 hypothetical protein, variant [Puccinia striiformis f. sp. tritici PST-78]
MPPPRPSSSSHHPTPRPSATVIEISDDEVTVISAPKVKSTTHTKRTSSASRLGGLDVSSWNTANRFKQNAEPNRPTESTSKSIPTLPTRRPVLASQSPQRKHFNLKTSNPSSSHKDSFDNSQPILPTCPKVKQPDSHTKELPKEHTQRVNVGDTSPFKKHPHTSRDLPHLSQNSKPNGDASRTVKQRENQDVNPARPARPIPGQKDVINKLNSFSYGPSPETNSTLKSTVGSLATNLIKTPLEKLNNDEQTSRAAAALQESIRARKLQQEATRTELKHLQSTIESRKKSAVFHHPTHARNDNPQSGSQSTGFHSSVAVKGKDTASSVHGSSHNPGVSSEVVVDAFLKEIDTCNDALKARMKRKHSESSKATWSMGVSNPDLTSSQMASTSALPPPPNPHNASSTNAGPLAAKDTSSGSIAPVPPCVFHAKPLMSLPKIIPRARPTSPDWSKIPLRERPLQGRERPDEFEDELQKTWIVTGNPDLSTSLGHSIFSDEINSKQMWENPQIPRIEVVVPDEVRDQMYEEAARGEKSTGLDQSLAPPMEFIYTDRLIYRNNERPIPPNWHCNCDGDCRNNPNCECRAFQTWMVREVAQGMNIELTEDITSFEGFAYHSTRKPRHSHAKKSDNGDVETRSVSDIFVNFGFPVFECNSLCGCGPDCINRTVGRGRREKLSIEKTISRGWGVFADHLIPAGRLVTHYSGEVITDAMSLERGQKKYDKIGRTYIFDLDPWWIETVHAQTLANDGLVVICESKLSSDTQKSLAASGSGLPNQNLNGSMNASSKSKIEKKNGKSKKQEENDVECIYSVDAFLYGNISRFINHSCSANTSIVPVYIDDSDPTRPIFAMFANKQIKGGAEITTSYSDPNSEEGKKTNKKMEQINESRPDRYMQCKCGASNCRGMMFA